MTAPTYPSRRSASYALYRRARHVLPDGSTRATVLRQPYPLYADHGHGSRIVDADGTERLDFVNNYTSLIHGHAHPKVVEAVGAAVSHGSAFGLPTESEVRLAEALAARNPSFERIRFTNSGTEAVMMAVKAARAYTGRPRIAKCEGSYHGAYDPVEVSLDSGPGAWGPNGEPAAVAYAAGTPTGMVSDTLVIPFNDPASAARLLTDHADQLAAVIIDPLPNRIGLLPARPDFLLTVRDLCAKHGITFISDEVISFRLHYGGAQAAFGYQADLTTLGKVIGGGFPVGAVAGGAEIMSVFERNEGRPLVPHAGTFNANPVTMAAGLATLELLSPDALDQLNALGARARNELATALQDAALGWQVSGGGSLFRIHPTTERLTGYRSARKTPAMQQAMSTLTGQLLNHGVLLDATGFGCLSTPMTPADVAQLAEGISQAVNDGDLNWTD
jgi:glutamate-1-semialdehyde 2,1-aminomutase